MNWNGIPATSPAYWDGNYERSPLFERETAIKVLETAGAETNVHKQGDHLYATLEGHELRPERFRLGLWETADGIQELCDLNLWAWGEAIPLKKGTFVLFMESVKINGYFEPNGKKLDEGWVAPRFKRENLDAWLKKCGHDFKYGFQADGALRFEDYDGCGSTMLIVPQQFNTEDGLLELYPWDALQWPFLTFDLKHGYFAHFDRAVDADGNRIDKGNVIGPCDMPFYIQDHELRNEEWDPVAEDAEGYWTANGVRYGGMIIYYE